MENLTPHIRDLAELLSKLTKWFEAHPRAGMQVALGAFSLVGAGAFATAASCLNL